jgi:hypothetical protein
VNDLPVLVGGGTEFDGMLARCAGKGAVLAMTRQLAVEGELLFDRLGCKFAALASRAFSWTVTF